MSTPIGDEIFRGKADDQRTRPTAALLRGWICPVCGAGIAPWKAEHCVVGVDVVPSS